MAYLCYHHNDMDGKSAGNEVYKYLERKHIPANSSMFIQRGYNEHFNPRDYEDKHVFIVDLSFTKTSIEKLFTICEGATSVTWIDHHSSSLECIEDDEILKKLLNYTNLNFFVNTGACGALLSHLYFNGYFENFYSKYSPDFEFRYDTAGRVIITDPDAGSQTVAIPMYLKHVDEWDRWVYGENQIPVHFNFGSDLHNTSLFAYPVKNAADKVYNSGFWKAIENPGYLNTIITEGECVKKYVDNQAVSNCAAYGYETKIAGHKAFVLNSSGNSMMAGNKIKEYDLICLWHYEGKSKKYVYSLYSDKDTVNCAKIATSLEPSGGGHPGAAGFSKDEMIFKPI